MEIFNKYKYSDWANINGQIIIKYENEFFLCSPTRNSGCFKIIGVLECGDDALFDAGGKDFEWCSFSDFTRLTLNK